jgi:flavin reductase (DIM6/NTAB) family NADH-FMN oxidoreductase RutF
VASNRVAKNATKHSTATKMVFHLHFQCNKLLKMAKISVLAKRCIANEATGNELRNVMRTVPSPVVVITTAYDGKKRGITCSSFTSVSLDPPIVSFCIRLPSRMSVLLHERERFGVNILAKHQVAQSVVFATPVPPEQDMFESVPHYMEDDGIPVLIGCVGVLHCRKKQVLEMGDHEVWFANVLQVDEGVGTIERELPSPLLYYMGKYRNVGDEVFMKSFEDATLSVKDWTHRNHLRLAWNYAKTFGFEEAKPRIKEGIRRYISANEEQFPKGFSETITGFWIKVMGIVMKEDALEPSKTFWQFLERWPLDDRRFINRFYSKEVLESEDAKQDFVEPDLTAVNRATVLAALS